MLDAASEGEERYPIAGNSSSKEIAEIFFSLSKGRIHLIYRYISFFFFFLFFTEETVLVYKEDVFFVSSVKKKSFVANRILGYIFARKFVKSFIDETCL